MVQNIRKGSKNEINCNNSTETKLKVRQTLFRNKMFTISKYICISIILFAIIIKSQIKVTQLKSNENFLENLALVTKFIKLKKILEEKSKTSYFASLGTFQEFNTVFDINKSLIPLKREEESIQDSMTSSKKDRRIVEMKKLLQRFRKRSVKIFEKTAQELSESKIETPEALIEDSQNILSKTVPPIVEVTTAIVKETTLIFNETAEKEVLETEKGLMNIIQSTSISRTATTRLDSPIEITTTITTTADTIETKQIGFEILQNTSKLCGRFLGKRISFANATTLMEYPWSALLVYHARERFHCGGSLISSKYVLTAAHCVNNHYYPLVSVRIGEHNIISPKDCERTLTYELICGEMIDVGIEEIIIHTQYHRYTLKNDIALIRLNQIVQYTRAHYPVCLPKLGDNIRRPQRATITGWGATEKNIRSNVLLQADIPVLDISACQENYGYRDFHEDREMCAGGVNVVDTCRGDSGGALFIRHRPNSRSYERYVQLGIISSGVSTCGDERFLPAVFTKVSYYISWIAENLKY